MTKLEEKFAELAYVPFDSITFDKYYNSDLIIRINSKELTGRVFARCFYSFKSQQDIDDLQQAFNVLQNDLEKLRQIESKENLKECIKALNDNFWD